MLHINLIIFFARPPIGREKKRATSFQLRQNARILFHSANIAILTLYGTKYSHGNIWHRFAFNLHQVTDFFPARFFYRQCGYSYNIKCVTELREKNRAVKYRCAENKALFHGLFLTVFTITFFSVRSRRKIPISSCLL